MNKDFFLSQIKSIIDSKNKSKFVPGETYIPVSGKIIDSDDVSSMVESCLDLWFTEGRFASEFKKDLRLIFDGEVRYASLCNSGSSANLLALTAITQKEFGERAALPGDEVITTACAFPTTVNGIVQNNLIPVFVDVELGTYLPKSDVIAHAVTEKTRAIILAHTLGNPFELESLRKIADENHLFLIGDACDALGSKQGGYLVGAVEDLSTLSFYPAHHITMGEGGAVLTNSSMLYRVIESLRSWGRDCWCDTGRDNTCGKRFDLKFENLPQGFDHKYVYSRIGYNFKITDMQAALGFSQLKKLPAFIEKRKHNWNRLYEGLKKYSKFFILPKATEDSSPSWFGFALTVKFVAPFQTTEIIRFLESKKIATRRLFAGNILRHPAYKEVPHKVFGKLYNSDYISENTFWIGVWPGITDEMIDYILQIFEDFIGEKAP